MPHKKNELKSIIERRSLKELGLIIKTPNETNTQKLENDFKNSELFIKSFKFYNSLIDSIREVNCDTPYSIISTTNLFPYLCSDNPIIFENSNNPKIYKDDYIFPISGNKLFIKANRTTNFSPYLKMLTDIIIFKQAIKYVSCTDEKYIYILEETFKMYNMTIEELKIKVFEMLK